MKTALMTIVMGDKAERLFRATGSYMAEYAAYWNIAFHVIKSSGYATIYPWWAKHEIGRLLETHDRVMYLDSDTYIMPDCPNLFDVVPEECVGLYPHGMPLSRDIFDGEAKAYAAVFGNYHPEAADFYYNAGVGVYSKIHKPLFNSTVEELNEISNRLREKGCCWDEQALLNGRVRDNKFPVYHMDYRFNHRLGDTTTSGKDRFDSYILHYSDEYTELILHDAPRFTKVANERRERRDEFRRIA